MSERILVVDDERTLCQNIARFLTRAGHVVTAVGTGRDALSELSLRSFDIVLTDLRLPDLDGLRVLDRVREGSPQSVVVIMTAYASVDSAVEALRRGAHDYMLKPISLADLEKKVANVAAFRRLSEENARLRSLLRVDTDAWRKLRRGGKAMSELCAQIDRVAASDANVLVRGESGSGKELVARALHERSASADGPFLTFHVSATSESDADALLFGAPAGDAGEPSKESLFVAASGGTLFFDEVSDLPLSLQAKLLEVVESKELRVTGATRPVRVATRIVAATHRDLTSMVREGTFRQDLLYRLQVVELRVPPLRARPGDIPQLAAELLEQHARAQRRPMRKIAPDALALLSAYAWPGNVRELSNVIERAVILSTDGVVTPIDLPVELGVQAAQAEPEPEATVHSDSPNLERATTAFQRAHVERVLRSARSRDDAARMLGLSPATLYRYLARLGLKGAKGADEGAGHEDEPSSRGRW